MGRQPIDVIGWNGIDNTTDPLILGKKMPNSSVLSYNLRAKNGIKVSRKGLKSVLDYGNGHWISKSGVYFPTDSYAHLPLYTNAFQDSFYLASTGSVEQQDITIEFWYKAEFKTYERHFCRIPVNFSGGITEHISIYTIHDGSTNPKRALLGVTLLNENPASPGTPAKSTYKLLPNSPAANSIPMDGQWHHLAIVFDPSEFTDDGRLYIDGSTVKALQLQTGSGLVGRQIPRGSTFGSNQTTPAFYHHLEIGDDEICMAEFRMWNDARSQQEIIDNKDKELEGTEDNLKVYIPFNEGQDKYFNEKVLSARGYFHPQEPFVNDDNELVFTGVKCHAFPSLRAKFVEDEDLTYETQHNHQSEDSAYDGGILWDTALTTGSKSSNYDVEGVLSGIAQIRLRLRQLKEGVICGRLGMSYDGSVGRYRLFFYDEAQGRTWTSNSIIDTGWLGTEKTITVTYDGTESTADDRVKFYVDTTDETSGTHYQYWGNTSLLVDHSSYRPFSDTTGTDDTEGALGGGVLHPEMCIAFDCIFFRQWWDDMPHDRFSGVSDAFLESTYNVDELPERYRILVDGVQGYLQDGDANAWINFSYFFTGSGQRQFIVMPFDKSKWVWEQDASGEIYVGIDRSGTKVVKSDVLVKRIRVWTGTNGRIIDATDTIDLPTRLEGNVAGAHKRIFFNGGIFSNLVNEYNYKTFRDNFIERPTYVENTVSGGANVDVLTKDLKINGCLVDDSPVQGTEGIGTVIYKSRYLILSSTADREKSNYRIDGMRAKWCAGPMSVKPSNPGAIRGIFRYVSENGDINRLLIVGHNAVLTLDPSTGQLTQKDFGWIDNNDGKPVNFTVVNNILVIMDENSAVKLNYLGNYSQLGIDRPIDIRIYAADEDNSDPLFVNGDQYGYVAQFRDSENDAYSGTIPILSAEEQTCIIDGNSVYGARFLDIAVRLSRQHNIDQVLVYRTKNLASGGAGTETDLFRINIGGISEKDLETIYRDVYANSVIDTQERYLPQRFYGNDLKPKPCKGISVGFNRLFLFGNENAKAGLYWSDVDSLGFGKPDMFPETYSMFIEEGETTEGRACIPFNGQLYAFKENAIFRVYQTANNAFGIDLIYKGVGAVNQRSVVLAANSLFFIDNNGVYSYTQGEPRLETPNLIDWFENNVNQDKIEERAFMLYDKKEALIMAFLPSSGSDYCDRCIVLDLRNKTVSLDLLPDVTCGYVDDDIVYLGSPYGQVLKYTTDQYTDVVDSVISGTTTALDSSSMTDSGASFSTDLSLVGAPVWLLDSTTGAMWKGIITENTSTVLTIDGWEELINASGSPSGNKSYYVGIKYFYDKTPIYTFLQEGYEKKLVEISVHTNDISTERMTPLNILVNDGVRTEAALMNIYRNITRYKTFEGLHRNFQFEYGFLADQEVKVKLFTFLLSWTASMTDQTLTSQGTDI